MKGFLGILLFYTAIFFMASGCGKEPAEPMTPKLVRQIGKEIDTLVTDGEIYLSDEDGNKLATQTTIAGRKAWVSGSFRYGRNLAEINKMIVVNIVQQRKKKDRVWCAQQVATNTMDEKPKIITFSAEIDVPMDTGERLLIATFMNIDLVKSKITVVKKSKKK